MLRDQYAQLAEELIEATGISKKYEFWKAAIEGKGPEISEEPHAGFYRARLGKAWLPVAIWWDGEKDESGAPDGDEKLVCLVGFSDNAQERDPNEPWSEKSANPASVWLVAAKNPVTEEAYRQAFDTGRWPDDAPEPERGIGDNLPEEPVEQVKAELVGEAEIVDEFLKTPVTTQEEADKIGPWVKRIREIGTRAEKIRVEEKQPFLDGGRAVDAKWRLPIDKAADLVKKLLKHVKPYLDEQERIRREAARAAAEEAERLRKEAEQREAERQELERKAAEAQQQAEGEAGGAAAEEAEHLRRKAEQQESERDELERRAAEAQQRTVVENPTAGRTGAKVGLRHPKIAVVEDYDALLIALKDRPEIKELVNTLAQRAARAGVALPGMKIVEDSRAA